MKMNTLSLFRTPTTDAGFSAVYQAQKRDYNERYSIHEQNATRWRYIAFGCIAITTIAVGGLVYNDGQPKYTPYVVERDHLGDEVAVGPAERVGQEDPRVIQADINRWIYDVRTVSSDAQDERNRILEAYDHTDSSSPAAGELNDWFRNNVPFKRAADTIVTITIISTLPTPADQWKTWTSKWKEEDRTRAGELVRSQVKEMSITVAHRSPKTETDFKKNHTGTFVQNFDWKN